MSEIETKDRWKQQLFGKPDISFYQGGNNSTPRSDEKFLAVTVVDEESGESRQFVATEALIALLLRKVKSIEYFANNSNDKKVGVSIEWKKPNEVWMNSTPQELEEVNRRVEEAIAQGKTEVDLSDIRRTRR